jgi:hypothetical protein
MVVVCQTSDGRAQFGFSIEFQPNIGWRVFIIFDPFHRGRDRPLDLPYQSIDNAGRRYVDWPPKIDTLDEAKIVARIWAELAQRDRRAQEERALYVELIQHRLSAGKQKKLFLLLGRTDSTRRSTLARQIRKTKRLMQNPLRI